MLLTKDIFSRVRKGGGGNKKEKIRLLLQRIRKKFRIDEEYKKLIGEKQGNYGD